MNVLKIVSRYTKSVVGPLYDDDGIESVNVLELVLPVLFDCVDDTVQVNVFEFLRTIPSSTSV